MLMVASQLVSDMHSAIKTTADSAPQHPRLIIVMGVCGSGKSTIAAGLAQAVDAMYLDGDDYHPAANIAKMSREEPLSDEDRWPWLQHFATNMAQHDGVVIGACSALKRSYRECITQAAGEPVLFVLLDGSRALIGERMAARTDHFMPDSLIDSQFATLERPETDECALFFDIDNSIEGIVKNITFKLFTSQ